MKEKIGITIDKEIYDVLQSMPRKVSVSEVINWSILAMIEDVKAGRESSSEELQEWMDSTPAGCDFRDRLIKHWGPSFKEIDKQVVGVKKKVKEAFKNKSASKRVVTR